eukprot:CAMPEP_0115494336 /NCGR_PEP_ID=MMETSP0271-20121206/64662_1 /TAXON_ID=71861 /ORGANISM="Scrippsiella trochoidea, Strain CCMP3099" /LENGTH=114 /DNA_ID=CAMNT_0002922901 /DNA_START=535 /DNA_END=876 /DNA_ORIENTATION=+
MAPTSARLGASATGLRAWACRKPQSSTSGAGPQHLPGSGPPPLGSGLGPVGSHRAPPPAQGPNICQARGLRHWAQGLGLSEATELHLRRRAPPRGPGLGQARGLDLQGYASGAV